MTAIIPGLIQHTVVVCVDKRERGIGVQASLQANGFRTIVTESLYDTLQAVGQEMPHLIISESQLSDGNAGILYDKLQQSPLLRRIPILACILRKSKADIAPLANRRFAGFIVGKPDPAVILPKAQEILHTRFKTSPFFLDAETCGVGNIALSTNAVAIGRSGDLLVVATDNEVDYRSSFHCTPVRQEQRPATLHSGVNLVGKRQVINLFPIHRILGPGRIWIDRLPKLPANPPSRTALVSGLADSSQWLSAMASYDIKGRATTRVEESIKIAMKSQVGVIVHFGSVAAPLLRKWGELTKKFSGKLPPLILFAPPRHPLAEATTVCPFPCSIGDAMTTIEASLRRYAMFEQYLSGGAGGTSFTYHNRAQFIGMDEMAGYVQMQVPMRPGNRFHAEHPFFDDFFNGQTLTVTKCMPTAESGTWQIRFEAPQAGQSKARFFESLLREVAPNELAS